MRGVRAALVVVASLVIVAAGSFAIHRTPTPKAAIPATARPPKMAGTTTTVTLPPTTTTTLPHAPLGLQWAPLGATAGGRAPMEVAFPTGTVAAPTAAVVWLDRTQVTPQLIPGRQLPGGVGWSPFAEVPPAERAALVAAFNGGFKFTDSRGGFYAQGRVAYPLVAGAASLVIRADGTATVGTWGRDVTLDPTVVAVRQNLVLLVDAGAPTADAARAYPFWGLTPNKSQLVWRSAIGVDSQDNLIYAASANILPAALAALMVQAGCVRAMQLDINHGFVTFNTYAPVATGVTGTTAPSCWRPWPTAATATWRRTPATSSPCSTAEPAPAPPLVSRPARPGRAVRRRPRPGWPTRRPGRSGRRGGRGRPPRRSRGGWRTTSRSSGRRR